MICIKREKEKRGEKERGDLEMQGTMRETNINADSLRQSPLI